MSKKKLTWWVLSDAARFSKIVSTFPALKKMRSCVYRYMVCVAQLREVCPSLTTLTAKFALQGSPGQIESTAH